MPASASRSSSWWGRSASRRGRTRASPRPSPTLTPRRAMSSEASGSASASSESPEWEAMGRALDLAVRGWGRVAPNPLVGAVVLQGGTVAGEGFHAEFGGPHAEIVALAAAGERARGSTVVVTLEAFAQHGKTLSCAAAVVGAAVTFVFAWFGYPVPRAPA